MPEQNKESSDIQIKPKSTLVLPQEEEEQRTKFAEKTGEILAQKEEPQDENTPTEYLGGTPETQQDKQKTLTQIQEEIRKLENVETVRDLRTLNVNTLIQLEDKFEGILLYAFTDAIDGSTKIDFANWKEYKEPAQGTKVKINFRGNPEAEMKVGACDIFPPSIRKITVYSQGDKNTARTSENRIGLKGRNRDGTGFFDSNGYIPIFSGDVVEIGGVDKEIDKKYRNEKGQIDESSYQKYETENGQKETETRENIFKKNPAAQRNKIMTPEEVNALMQQIETSGTGKKVVESAIERTKSYEQNRSCWTVCEQIYQRAGVRRRNIYHAKYDGPDCGDNHASPELISRIQPGDWLFLNVYKEDPETGKPLAGVNPKTGKPYDRHGNHSVLFLRWLDRENMIAQVVSGGSNTQPHVHKSNLKKSPVTFIAKPV